MRLILSCAVVSALVLGVLGCAWPWRKEEDSAKRRLGVTDERVKTLDVKGVDAEMARSRGGLRLTARADKTEYLVGEPIVVDVRLENVSSTRAEKGPGDIQVYFEPVVAAPSGQPVEWLIKFSIRSEDDEKLIYRSPDLQVPEERRADYYHFVTLPPESFVGRRFVFWPSRARGLMERGRYSLVVSYVVSDEFPYVIINRHLTRSQVELLGKELAYARIWTGRINSERIEFRIRRKKLWGIF